MVEPGLIAVDGKVPQVIFPGGDGWIYAFTPDKGELIWKFDANPKTAVYELGGAGTQSDFIATPVIYDNKIYIGTGQDPEHFTGIAHFYCIDPAGKTGDISPEVGPRAKPGDGEPDRRASRTRTRRWCGTTAGPTPASSPSATSSSAAP